MKKRIFISALIAFTLIFGNVTVFADNSDILLDDEYSYDEYSDDYDYEYSDDYNYEYSDDYDYEYSDNYNYEYSNDDGYEYSSEYYKRKYGESDLRSYGYVGDDSNVYFKGDYYLDETVYYRDESKRFTDSQKQQIVDLLKATSKKIGFNLAVFTGGYMRTDEVVERLAATGSQSIFKKSSKIDSIFLYVDLDGERNAYDYMDCYREPCLYYFATANMDDDVVTRIDRILSAMQEKFPAGGAEIYFKDIYAGLQVYCQQLEYYKNKGMEDNAYYFNSDTGKYICAWNNEAYESNSVPRPFKNFGIVLIISIIAGIITFATMFFGVKNSYKFKTPVSASQYTSSNKTFVNNKVDLFLGSRVSKVRISSSSGGSHHGGGHSHHSGGGRSGHSGGGHHR